MKKLLSLFLAVVLVFSVIPAVVFESSAASGSLPLDMDVYVTTSAGEWVVNTFRPTEDGIYIFSSSGTYDTLGYIALNEGEAENQYIKDDGGEGNNFAVTYNMRAGVTYYLGSTLLTGSGSYTVKIVKFEIDDNTIGTITAGKNTSVSVKKANGTKFCSFVPTFSGKYVYCSSGNYDTQGYIFDENWSQIAYADVGGAVQNFEMTLDLQAGKTYYVGYATNSYTTATFNILIYLVNAISSVSVDTLPEKTVYYKNLDAILTSGGKYSVNLLLSGLKFNVNYANGSTETKTHSYSIRGFECETSQKLNAGTNNVRFSYMGKASSFEINVNDSPVRDFTIVQQPKKNVYYDEDITIAKDEEETPIFNILLTGMMLKIEYTDGSEDYFRVNSAYGEEVEYFYFDHVKKAEDMILGPNTFTFSYFGIKKTFQVTYSLNAYNWQYEVVAGSDGSYVRLTKYIGTESEAIIPETLSDLPVKEIGERCFYENHSITSINMTERITTIGSEAFYNCKALTELTLPSVLTSVGEKAFFGMKNLEKLNWNAPSISYEAGKNMFALLGADTENGTTVEFGMTCLSVPEQAFYGYIEAYIPKISKIIIGENVSNIGNQAFRNLSALKFVEYNAVNASVSAANNIWTNSNSGNPSFELEVGEYVETLPSGLFYSSSQKSAPKLSKVTIWGKDTVLNRNCLRNNDSVECTYYVWYNPNNASSAYNYVIGANYTWELLDPNLERLYVYSGALKTDFVLEEDFSLGDVELRAVFDDGSQKKINDLVEVAGYDNTTVSDQTITLSYTSALTTKTFTYQIHMLEKPLVLDYITITKQPNKSEYEAGESLDLEGIAVSATFTNGTSQEVSEEIVLGEYDMSVLGEQTISIFYTYEGVTRSAEFSIFIKPASLTNLILTVPEENTNYVVGSPLNKNGIMIIAEYSDGTQEDVSLFAEYSGYDMNVLGEQNVTVSYTENGLTQTESFKITVHNYLTDIVLDAPPTQRSFVLGGNFNPEGIIVSAIRENNTSEDVSDLVSYSGYNMNEEGAQTVTVTYTENGISKSTSFQISVKSATLSALEIVSEPTNTQYQNRPLDTRGLKVVAHYSGSLKNDVTSAVELSGYDMSAYGEQIIYVSYTEGEVSLKKSFSIDVIRQTPSEITITKLPEKAVFEVGSSFSATGIEAEVVYNNSLTAVLGEPDLNFIGYNMAASGKQTVIVSYSEGGKTVSTNYEIELLNRETAVSITSLPSKTNYYVGEQLDISGLVVSATMANGNSMVIANDKLEISGFDNQSEGNQTIAVSYTSPITEITYNMSFDVNVVSGLKSIAITSQPSKTIFYYGDELDTSGMAVTAYYADNTNKPVTEKCVLSGYNMNTVGMQTVTVTYTEGSVSKTATYNINVKDYATSIYISNMPSKLNYNLGEPLSTSSLAVKAHFAVGVDRAVTSSVTTSGFESETPGIKTVTISYNTDKGVLQTSYNVTVYDTVKNFEITSGLGKDLYDFGEELDTSTLQAQAETSTGVIINIPYSDLSITGYNPNVRGRQFVNVSYKYDKGEASEQIKVFVEYDDSCDVNGDLFVDLSDISAILAFGNYMKPIAQAANAKCDVNADGTVSILDISQILDKENYAKAIG